MTDDPLKSLHLHAQMCAGKEKLTGEAARKVAEKMRKKRRRVEAYRCLSCGHWHVGRAQESKPPEHRLRAALVEEVGPTPERKRRGAWQAMRDVATCPIDRLAHVGAISRQQADAGRTFEAMCRAAREAPAIRDSLTLWEPKGHSSDDGPVAAKDRLRSLEAALGRAVVARLVWVCVDHKEPRGAVQLGQLREDLNELRRALDRRRGAVSLAPVPWIAQ